MCTSGNIVLVKTKILKQLTPVTLRLDWSFLGRAIKTIFFLGGGKTIYQKIYHLSEKNLTR